MPAQLHQVAAMAFVYRRLVIVTCALPLMMLFSPFVFFVVLGLLRQCTDFGLLTTALTIILTLAARDQIHRLSNSKEALEASLRKNQVVLPLFMFVLSCVASGVLGPALDKMGLATMIRTPGSIRIWTAVRLSVAVLLLGMLVAARFVGPTSISTLSA